MLLAIKAANIHLRFPEKKILFTFNTQSLYNHVKTLITKLYRVHSNQDPDWDKLHIRHAWGGVSRPGVYYELCSTLGLIPYNYTQVQNSYTNPFIACCKHALSRADDIRPIYDYILVDEAQDFPKEFFHLLYKLSHDPHCICWVYDELQSLSKTDFPPPEELFGSDDQGKPLVSLRGDPYPGHIEKDFVLHKSYRCPQQVLMLAHAIGLGLYSPKGCVQMFEKAESWQAIGYHIEDGELRPGEDVTIYRPPENSPNTIADIYHGQQNVVTTKVFAERDEEIAWIAQSIKQDIEAEQVAPENIVVICLKALEMRTWLPRLQKALFDLDVASTIPGVNDASSSFAEKGRVTLSTVFRAKGNEAYIVYIFSFEALYDYVHAVDHRNRAFTAISRSKAWVRITGTGDRMQQAQNEIDRILAHLPRFHFTFPDMDDIRRLDAETEKRQREFRQVTEIFKRMQEIDPAVIDALEHEKPELVGNVKKLFQEVPKK